LTHRRHVAENIGGGEKSAMGIGNFNLRSSQVRKRGKIRLKVGFSILFVSKQVKVKLQQSCYRPGVAQRVPGS
jgi:hypothetical protein